MVCNKRRCRHTIVISRCGTGLIGAVRGARRTAISANAVQSHGARDLGRSIRWTEPEGSSEKADAAKERYNRSLIRDITRGETEKKEDLTPAERETYEALST